MYTRICICIQVQFFVMCKAASMPLSTCILFIFAYWIAIKYIQHLQTHSKLSQGHFLLSIAEFHSRLFDHCVQRNPERQAYQFIVRFSTNKSRFPTIFMYKRGCYGKGFVLKPCSAWADLLHIRVMVIRYRTLLPINNLIIRPRRGRS